MSNIFAEYEITTDSGIAQGYKKNNLIYWDDIPYAKPPVNESEMESSSFNKSTTKFNLT